jgi:hypothetical protein
MGPHYSIAIDQDTKTVADTVKKIILDVFHKKETSLQPCNPGSRTYTS